MDSPLLSLTTETCGTSEICRTPQDQQYWKNPSIHRVPGLIANLNPNAYWPQVVSFGPYHHGKDHLLYMEEHKRRALNQFLNRSGKTCEDFLKKLREAQHLEESYEALDPKWKNGTGDQFLELMIRDGCFMLEIMRHAVGKEKNDYPADDPIFSTHRLAYIAPYISRDMLMLENQLPMLVLEHLVAVETNNEKGEGYIHDLILDFHFPNMCVREGDRFLHVMDVFRTVLLTAKKKIPCGTEAGIIRSAANTCVRGMDAFLHVFGKGLLTLAKMVQCGREAGGGKIIWPATELNRAGIRFEESETDSLKDISFSKGVLRLPVITVDDDTESTFLNIMTFERLHIGAATEVTCYVTFMDSIINNEQDVALLHDQGIIQNAYGTDKEVAKLFNSLCKDVTVESNSNLEDVQEEISRYCKEPWHRWRANLNRTYFRSPWAILSLIAAIFLFALTIIQTVYAVLTYY